MIEHREALIYMICEAAELEHLLMCEYLFAAFSLKDRPDATLADEQLEAVHRWRRVLLGVAREVAALTGGSLKRPPGSDSPFSWP